MPEEAITYPKHRACPECAGLADITTFRPAGGLDPGMREYVCRICHYDWYHIPKTPANPVKTNEGVMPL